jgi:hypothetical protein
MSEVDAQKSTSLMQAVMLHLRKNSTEQRLRADASSDLEAKLAPVKLE